MNNSTIMNVGRVLALTGMALLTGAGCVATTGGSAAYQEANQREDYALVQEKMRRLEGDMESLNLQIEQLNRDLQRIQANSAHSAEAQTSALRSTQNSLEDRVHTLESQRESDRLEIVNTLSLKVAKMLDASAAASPPPSRGSPAASGYGYEHIVQAGETLSQIAKAYGTTVSAIQKANNLKDADALHIGQKLFIPE